MSKTQVQIPRYLNSHINKSSSMELLFTLYTLDTPGYRITDLSFDS